MKKSERKKILILGATGLIGKNLFKYLKKKKLDVIGTFFKNKTKNYQKFNLVKDNFNKVKKLNLISHIIIASGSSKKLDDIEKDYSYENKIGYVKLKKVINECVEKKIKVIYISSDAIFDGIKGNYKESSKRNPINKYGEIKLKMEEYIQKKTSNYLIVRISKVFGINKNENSILNDMIKNLNQKYIHKYAHDEYFTPIFTNDLSLFIYNLIKKDLSGIFHLRSVNKISRYELVKKVNSYFKLKKLIEKCSINLIGLKAKRGLKLHLNTEKYEKIFNHKQKKIEHYLKKY